MAYQSRTSPTRAAAVHAGSDLQNGIWESSAMWTESEIGMVGLSFVVQLLGIGGVLAARWSSARKGRARYDMLALLCFAVVGVLSLLMMREFTGCWLAFATTMPLMAVGATMDVSKRPRAASF